MSQGSGGGNYSGRGKINPNSVLEVSVRLAPLRGVSIHSGKPRPSFRSPAWLGDGASEEVTPPAASAPGGELVFASGLVSFNKDCSPAIRQAPGAAYTVKIKTGVIFSLSELTDYRKSVQ